jgi:hypothetical protein
MNTENNKLIAEFLSFELQQDCSYQTKPNDSWGSKVDLLHFDTDWNWLAQVVDKIEGLGYWTRILSATNNGVYIGELNSPDFIIESDGLTKKQAVYSACIEFIKWYNK